MNLFTRFLLFCSGTNTDLIPHVDPPFQRSVIIRQSLIGTTILLTGVLASVAGGYALYTVFDKQLEPAIGFGLLWGFVIFNLDRVIVYSMATGHPVSRFFQALFRISLAVLIALTVSRPLELKIFDDEIQEQLVQNLKEDIKQAVAEAELLQAEQYARDSAVYTSRLLSEQQQVESLSVQVEVKHAEMIAEINGTGGTRTRGYGKRAKELEERYHELRVKRDSAVVRLEIQQALLTELTNALPAKQDSVRIIAEAETRANQSKSLMAQHRALAQIQREGEGDASRICLIITLLFIFLETSPILAKILSRDGPYEALLARYENPAQIKLIKESYDAKSQIDVYKDQIEKRSKTEQLRILNQQKIEQQNIAAATKLAEDKAKTLQQSAPQYFARQILGNSVSWLFDPPPTSTSSTVPATPVAHSISTSPVNITGSRRFTAWKLIALMILCIVAAITALWIIDYQKVDITEIPIADTPSISSSIPSTDSTEPELSKDTAGTLTIPPLLPSPGEADSLFIPFTFDEGEELLAMTNLFDFPDEIAEWEAGDKLDIIASTNDSILIKSGEYNVLTNLRKGDRVEVVDILGDFDVLDLGGQTLNYYGTWLKVRTSSGKEGKLFSYFTKRGRACHCREVEASMQQNPFYVRDSPLIVREAAVYSKDVNKIVSLTKDEDFKILSRKLNLRAAKVTNRTAYGFWCEVNADGRIGYIFDYFTYKGLDYYYCLRHYGKLPKNAQ